jgi:hypothetical protein
VAVDLLTVGNNKYKIVKGVIPKDKTFKKWLSSGKYRLDESLEIEKRCFTCREYFPADTEFFYLSNTADRLDANCVVCYEEKRRSRKGLGSSRGYKSRMHF